MPLIAAGTRAKIILDGDDVCRVSTTGIAKVVAIYGAPKTPIAISASSRDFGPYQANVKLIVDATSGPANFGFLAPATPMVDTTASIGPSPAPPAPSPPAPTPPAPTPPAPAPAATITPVVTFNRTSGVAPVVIFADATGTTSTAVADTFRQASVDVDFGEPGLGNHTYVATSRNQHSGGLVFAHLYETPGTYTITMPFTDGGTPVVRTQVITITDEASAYPGTATVCIDPSGIYSGAPAGSAKFTSLSAAGGVQSNKRYLLARGQTYGDLFVPDGVTNTRFDAFGSGAKPQFGLFWVAQTPGQPLINDITVRNILAVTNINLGRGGGYMLALDCDVVPNFVDGQQPMFNVGDDTYLSSAVGRHFIRCTAKNPNHTSDTLGGYGIFGCCAKSAIMDCDMGPTPLHGIRLTTWDRVYLAHNRILGSDVAASYHALKMHAAGTKVWDYVTDEKINCSRYAVVNRNVIGSTGTLSQWTMTVEPQNDERLEGCMDALIEFNEFSRGPNTVRDVIAAGQRITSRNNVVKNGSPGSMVYETGVGMLSGPNASNTAFVATWNGPYYLSS